MSEPQSGARPEPALENLLVEDRRFPPSAAFHRQLAEEPKNAGLLRDALYELTGRKLVVAFAGSMALSLLVYLLLHRTRLGTAIRAVADNPRGAALVGIDVRRMYVLAFAIGTAAVAAAGALVLPFVSVDPTTGDRYNIIAFVVVVLGGLGSVFGALLGGVLIGLVQYLGGAMFPGVNNLLVVFAVFVLTLLFRPQGLFGRRP